MTISELEGLLREHLPQIAVPAHEQGRAGVTKSDDRHVRYDSPGAYWLPKCAFCRQPFMRCIQGRRRLYGSDACQQKAYRRRKKQAQAGR